MLPRAPAQAPGLSFFGRTLLIMGLSGYELVALANGTWSVRCREIAETFHPVVGPVAEAEALYVRQLRLPERIAKAEGRFTLWDVGLGAAANVCTVLTAAAALPGRLQIVSFDRTLEPLRFALENRQALSFLEPFQAAIRQLVERHEVSFTHGALTLDWKLHLGDFPSLLRSPEAAAWPKPDAILFDAFSPAKNPDMWTLPVFRRVFELLDPARPCALATYSRSSLLRVTLLRAGFFVGAGHRTGEKEETTIAANRTELVEALLGASWMGRASRSRSAEPMLEGVYEQHPLSAESREALERHPQFRGVTGK